MIGRLTTTDQRQHRGRSAAARTVVEGVRQCDVTQVEKEQDQHRGQPGVPHPPCAPHRATPQRAGGEADEGERRADRSSRAGRHLGQRMAPDERGGARHRDEQIDALDGRVYSKTGVDYIMSVGTA
jgi:hypothetical protein